MGLPAAAQVEAPVPAPSAPSVTPRPAAPSGPAIGGTIPGGFQPGGFGGFGPPGALLSPESRFRTGTIGFPFTAVGEVPGQPTRRWSLTPSLGLEQTYNDNIGFTSRNRRQDFITRVTPGILLGVDTVRLQGTLNYAPNLDFYWRYSDENRISHNGNAQFLGTIVPDFFFVDARGAASVTSLSGGFTPQSDVSTSRANQVQTTTFSVSPYVVQRFRGLATARAGYVFSYVDQQQADRGAPIDPTLLRSNFTPSEYTSHQGYLVVRTGEDFGRLAVQGSLSGTTFDGSGQYDGAYRNIGLVETRYAVTRWVAGLVELGYETQRFNTVPVTDISEPVWAFGARITPNPESVIVAKYGQRDGFESFFLDGSLSVGVRTRLFARYEERLTNSALAAGDLLATTTLDPLGNPVDAITGAPVLPAFATNQLGILGGLARETRATASASQTWTRDTFSLFVSYTERQPVADAPGARRRNVQSEGYSIGGSWARELDPETSLVSTVSYGISSQQGGSDSNTYNARISLIRLFRPGLAGSLTYQFNMRDGGTTNTGQNDAGRATQNIITAGLRQTF